MNDLNVAIVTDYLIEGITETRLRGAYRNHLRELHPQMAQEAIAETVATLDREEIANSLIGFVTAQVTSSACIIWLDRAQTHSLRVQEAIDWSSSMAQSEMLNER